MTFTVRELWAAFHGMALGGGYLLLFSGMIYVLWSLKPGWAAATAAATQVKILKAGTVLMAVVMWLTVFIGTYVIYPWYRAKPPAGLTDLADYPRYFLVANPNLAAWHNFGMEWKEHVAWLAPILASAVAAVICRYGPKLIEEAQLRKYLIILFSFAFVIAGIVALLGAFITKAAPLY